MTDPGWRSFVKEELDEDIARISGVPKERLELEASLQDLNITDEHKKEILQCAIQRFSVSKAIEHHAYEDAEIVSDLYDDIVAEIVNYKPPKNRKPKTTLHSGPETKAPSIASETPSSPESQLKAERKEVFEKQFQKIEKGKSYFLVAKGWWDKWNKFTDGQTKDKPGAVDTRTLQGTDGGLQPDAREGKMTEISIVKK